MSAIPQLQGATLIYLRLSGDMQDAGLGNVHEIVAQLPEPHTLAPGTVVAVAGTLDGQRSEGLLARLLKRTARVQVHRAARCTALLARGYDRVGAGVDDQGTDWAWGFVAQ